MYVGYYIKDKISIKILADDNDIVNISFIQNKDEKENVNKIIEKCKSQLEEYFNGKRKIFDVNYKIEGTEFQRKVWNELLKIDYGITISYKEVAERIGNAKSVRAVANAIGKNRIGIIIPCHRVIGSNGTLTGYAGGLENKQKLLDIEGVF